MKIKAFLQFVIFLLIITTSLGIQVKSSYTQDVDVQLEELNESVNQAFINVLAVEQSGGDITLLLQKLNTAGGLLAEAQNAYASGDSTTTSSNIETAQKILDQVNIEANALLEESLAISKNNTLITLLLSIFCSAIFIIILKLLWNKFKGSYTQRILGSKPEIL